MFLRRLFCPLLLLCAYFQNSPAMAGERVNASVVVLWEGSQLEDLNVQALAEFRQDFPQLPLVHLINPSYFKNAETMKAIARTVNAQDEVGLYIAPMHSLLKEADVVPHSQPTFWGYSDEADFCREDCGLHVPLSTYSRDEVMKVFWTAHAKMQEAGFQNLKTFAVRGWMAPAGVEEIGKALGYTDDLTRIDPNLVAKKLKEFPIARWISVPAFHVVTQETPRAWVQKGGVVEFHRVEDIVQRLRDFAQHPRENRAMFSITLSQENVYMNKGRLSSTVREMQKFAEKSGMDLSFQTASGAKNSRPLLQKVRLSRNP